MTHDRIMNALFDQQRTQLMFIKSMKSGMLSDSYSFAWAKSVYPFLHDGDRSITSYPHETYPDQFHVSAEFGKAVHKYLGERWRSGNSPTFYELEDKFGGRDRRSALINICQYLFLKDEFNVDLWEALLTPEHHPSEAISITDPLAYEDFYIR